MDHSDKQLADVASVLSYDAHAVELGAIERVLSEGRGNDLVARMLLDARKEFATENEAASSVMAKFESLSSKSETMACLLMVHMWRHTSAIVGLHDLSDAIDLWLSNCKSRDFSKALIAIASTESDPVFRSRIRRWIQSFP